MFREFPCGCILSQMQGRVRICTAHRPERGDGRGAAMKSVLKGSVKLYPANGEMVRNWGGR